MLWSSIRRILFGESKFILTFQMIRIILDDSYGHLYIEDHNSSFVLYSTQLVLLIDFIY